MLGADADDDFRREVGRLTTEVPGLVELAQ
jgi:hypothetical protein